MLIHPPGLLRPDLTLLTLDRPLWRPGFDIYDFLVRHGIEPTASIVNMMLMAGGVIAPMPVIYDFTGVDQAYVVPWGVYRVLGKLWGAAGGCATTSTSALSAAGGYTVGEIAVTPGETLTIIAPEGGHPGGSVETYGGGGPGGTSTAYGASGGGRAAIRRGSTELAAAGGGGAQGYQAGAEVAGAGGGLTGVPGTGTYAGGAGTQTAGGAATAGNTTSGPGTAFHGGPGTTTNNSGGLGGGGGFYGGGGGQRAAGGGSGYIGGMTNATTTAGSGGTPPATTDPHYATGIAVGAAAGQSGGPGRVVIIPQ